MLGLIAGVLFLIAMGLTYGVRKLALKKSILDIPNHRSSHRVPTPRGGGLGFVVAFYVGLFLLRILHRVDTSLFLALLGGILVAWIGYRDDRGEVKARWRALVQLLAAIWGIYWLGGASHWDFGVGVISIPFVLSVLAVIATVWFINLYNFMDGIDGIAGMETVFAATAAGIFLGLQGSELASVCVVFAASTLGFLVWNWPPAKIFMGDIGSGFLGYVFAMLIWASNNTHQLSLPFWITLFFIFIFDTTYTLIYRIIQGKKWYLAHREHGYQRLVQAGFSHRTVTVGVLILNLVLAWPFALLYTQ
ncbi:MAG: glycosyltransferase family 4 protein, partial [Gammaproteobacteria bacterium]|nr:glycosyltransferase family 4 protein [Gammaproteobacteria bacterium]